jgi:hypothetical protein
MRQQTQKHPNADTPDGKEKIEDAEKNLRDYKRNLGKHKEGSLRDCSTSAIWRI